MALHRLSRDDSNIHHVWDASIPPVLTIDSGDEVVVETQSGEGDQLKPGDTPEALDRFDRSRLHALTGPIEVLDAAPGNVLAVEILEATPASWGFIMQRPGGGLLKGFDPYLRFFDLTDSVIEFSDQVQVPVQPFLGIMGVAPAGGRHPTEPPGDHGGNLDCPALTAGAILYLPIAVPGALFSCGDGHAAQGDGEVCVTAIECAMETRLRFELEADRSISSPQVETADSLMTLGAGATIEEASHQALEGLVQLISSRTDLDRADAYAVASAAGDLRINQVVNHPMLGVRAVIPKAVLGLN